MNKSDLVEHVSQVTGLRKRVVQDSVNALLQVVQEGLEKGEKVKMVNFGTFRTVTRRPRPAVNLQTMEKVYLPERRAVVFSPGRGLKGGLNK